MILKQRLLNCVQTNRSRMVVTLLLVFLTVLSAPALRGADDQTQLVRDAVSKTAQSVVRIRTIGDPGAENLSVSSQTTTGVVISGDGQILTSVFGFSGQPAAVFVEGSDGSRVAASVAAIDHVRKLVLLQCESGDFKPVTATDSRWPPVGATAIALGRFYPGSEPSVSVGIVSAVRRIHGLAIQTDAKISPVNYGGPLIGLDGLPMGILVPLSPQDTDGITAGVEWYDSGIGFCIPLADALKTAERLRTTGQNLVRGRLGVRLSTRNPLAQDVQVTTVHPGSPAEEAGLKKGDVIVSVSGKSVDRLGHFQTVVKSSYAGDRLKLTVERDGKELETEAVLTDRLQIPDRGYLGVVPGDAVKAKKETPAGVSVRVLPGSPADKAGLPETAIVTKWGEDTVSARTDLLRSLRSAVKGQDTAIEYVESSGTEGRVTVSAEARPETIEHVSDDFVAAVTSPPDSDEWRRSEEALGEQGKVWMYAPKVSLKTKSGLLVLLSAAGEAAETVVNRWKTICQQHNLVLAVPSAADASELSREHVSVVLAAFTAVTKGRGLDTSRVVLVTGKRQAELCSELLLHPRAVLLRSAVFKDCRPRVSGASQELLLRKSVSILFQNGTVRSRQAVALQQQVSKILTDAGAFVMNAKGNDSSFRSPEEQIATWTFHLKVH